MSELDLLTEAPQERDRFDFSGCIQRNPLRTARVASEEHARAVLGASGRTALTLRGAGHSCAGQSLSDGGLLLENFAPDTEAPVVLEGDVARISARSSWSSVERRLNSMGRSAPVLTDYLRLSVGGTLSVGGIGVDSLRYGMQIDSVQELRVIDGAGRIHTCSLRENDELFRFALAGLGQSGMIESAAIQTVPHRPYVRVRTREHDRLPEFLRFLGEVSEDARVEHFNAWLLLTPGGVRCVSEFGCREDAPDSARSLPSGEERRRKDYAFVLHDRRTRWLESFGDACRLWSDVFFDYDALCAVLPEALQRAEKPPLSASLKVIYLLIVRRGANAPDFPLAPMRDAGTRFSLGFYAMAEPTNAALLAGTVSGMQALFERCIALGGRPYRYGRGALSGQMMRDLYGDQLDALRAIRKRYNLERVNAGLFQEPSGREERRG